MPQNGIRMAGSAALAEGLAKNAGLELLDLQDNTLSQPGDQAFATALPSWPDLHTLNFSDCVLSEEGEVPQVIEALAKGSNPRLRILQLQNDNLENSAVSALAQAIGTHLKAVSRIEFQENDAEEDDPGIEILRENLLARGGKFLFSDEEEEEEDEEEDDLQDAEEGGRGVQSSQILQISQMLQKGRTMRTLRKRLTNWPTCWDNVSLAKP